MNIIVVNLIIACAYFISGRLGFFLAMDSGHATILWPGSGIALACVYVYGYRVLPSVLLATIALVWVYYSDMQSFSSYSTLFGYSIVKGLCPMLQAAISVGLLYKFIGKDTRLETFGDVTKFILIGGFCGCAVSPTSSLMISYWLGFVSWSDFYASWMTWYIGDVLGVLVLGPVILLVLRNHTDVEVKRKVVVSISLISALALYVLLFGYISTVDRREAEQDIESNAMLFSKTLELEFQHYVTELYAFQELVNTAQVFDSEAFMRFSDKIFEIYPAMEALQWSPLIADAHKKVYEVQMRAVHGDDFLIFSHSGGEKHEIDVGKKTYFPVTIFKSRYPNENFYGYDLSSNPDTEALIHQSIENGQSRVQQASFILSGKNAHSILAILPVYGGVRANDKVALGVVSLVFSYDKILSSIALRAQDKGINIFLEDIEGNTWKKLRSDSGKILKRSIIRMGDIEYTLIFAKQKLSMSWSLWYALGASVVAISLFSGFLLTATGQLAVTQQIVGKQTQKLQQSSNFLKQIMDNVPDYIFVKNRNSEIIAANKAFLELYSPNDREGIVGKTGLEMFPQEHQDVYLREDKKAFEVGSSETYEDNVDYQGVLRHFLTRKKMFSDDQGNDFILGIARDMTDFLLAQNKLQSVFDNTVDGLLMVDNDGVIDTYNKACQNILGYSSDEAIGQNVRMFRPEGAIPSRWADEDAVIFNFDEHVLSKVLETNSVVYVQHKTGRIFPIHLAVSKIVIGGATFFSAIIRDISKEKEAEEELKRSNRELEAFAYVASHDLKAPLRHISMSAEFLKQKYADQFDDTGLEFLDIMVNSSHRMADMIESLMAYSRVGHEDSLIEVVSLNDILKDTLHVLKYRIQEVGAEINIQDDLPNIEADANLIGQLFQNLIDNAMKYQPEGQGPIIGITLEDSEDGLACLRVQDNGIGISAEYKDKIFSIFQRLHNSDSYAGTGVGLSICKRIVDFHKGEIYLDTDCISGSCFIVKLPLA